MLSDVAIDGNELETVVHDMKIELTGKRYMHWIHNLNNVNLLLGRDNQIANLQDEVKQLLNTLKHMKEEMKHKENGISQLKSQLEYQCLGKFS